MPTVAETVVQRTGVEEKPLEQHGKTGKNTEGNLQWKEGCNMHGTAQVYQLLMCNTMAHHACSASIPED